jgi:hypothetical protein
MKIKVSTEIDGYLKADHLKISTTSIEPVDVGEIVWNQVDGTFDMGLIGGVTLQAGQEMHIYGKANEAISNGEAVMFAGVQGDHILIARADATTINENPEYLIGVSTQSFTTNQFGYVTTLGNVRGLNTLAYTLGTILYYNSESTTDGLLTATEPTAPNAKIEVATVVRVHETQGILLVRPHVMSRVKDLQDIYAPSPTQAKGLFWNNTNSRYQNYTVPEILGYTPANDATVVHKTGDETITGTKTFQQTATSAVCINAESSNYGGVGVKGVADNTGGFGIYGKSANTSSGYAGWFEGQVSITDKLGIGTSTPKSSLHVSKNGNVAGGSILLGDVVSLTNKYGVVTGTNYDNLLYQTGVNIASSVSIASENRVNIGGGIDELNSANTINFYTTGVATIGAGTIKMKILSDGNIGIGTITPDAKLEIRSDVVGDIGGYLNVTNKIDSATVGHSVAINMGLSNSGVDGFRFLTKSPTSYGNIPDLFIQSQSNGVFSNRVTIKNDGKVGIGIDSPGESLHIGGTGNVKATSYKSSVGYGDVQFTAYYSGALILPATSTGTVYIGNTSDTSNLQAGGTGTFNSGLVSGSTIKSTYKPNGYITGDVLNHASARIGNSGDFIRVVILLHPVYNGTLIGYNECDGVFTKRRGSATAGMSRGSYKVQTKTAYNLNTYSITSSNGGNGSLYTCTYGGIKYVALIPDFTNSGCEYSFDGYSRANSNPLLVVPYLNNNTSVVLNSEINNSLVLVQESDGNVTSVTAGSGMTFTTITGAGTVTLGTPSTLDSGTTNSLTTDSHTHTITTTDLAAANTIVRTTGDGLVNGTGLGVTNNSATTGRGLSLYAGAVVGKPTYGIMFAGTTTFGTYGAVTADWATYFTMNNTANRGWIFKAGDGTAGNVASISTTGAAYFAGVVATNAGVTITTGGVNITSGGVTSTITNASSIFTLGTTSAHSVTLRTNNIVRLTIDSAGAATFGSSVTATAFYQTSDLRLKDIISQDGDVIKFTWKDKRDELIHIGYVAQEIQKTNPDQVQEDKDGMLSVNYIEILVQKIQDLENRIKQLEK